MFSVETIFESGMPLELLPQPPSATAAVNPSETTNERPAPDIGRADATTPTGAHQGRGTKEGAADGRPLSKRTRVLRDHLPVHFEVAVGWSVGSLALT